MTPQELTEDVVQRLEETADPRLREVMQSLTRHLHAFADDVTLTQEEWLAAIRFLTATGQKCDERRQEFVLLSDTLGLSSVVDILNYGAIEDATESSLLGPFYVPGSPEREYGASIAEVPSGDPAWVTGWVRDVAGSPIAGATLDVWQNADNMLYAVQDPLAPQTNLRGRFTSRDDGSYALLAVRPTDYPIPTDGPVGGLLEATGRHPWRAAHIHFLVTAPGCKPLVTEIFDHASEYLGSDAVFGVRPSLIHEYTRHEPGGQERPPGVGAEQLWYSLEYDFVLTPA